MRAHDYFFKPEGVHEDNLLGSIGLDDVACLILFPVDYLALFLLYNLSKS
jgi:hypothetical protein